MTTCRGSFSELSLTTTLCHEGQLSVMCLALILWQCIHYQNREVGDRGTGCGWCGVCSSNVARHCGASWY